jgi:hypothetical protein
VCTWKAQRGQGGKDRARAESGEEARSPVGRLPLDLAGRPPTSCPRCYSSSGRKVEVERRVQTPALTLPSENTKTTQQPLLGPASERTTSSKHPEAWAEGFEGSSSPPCPLPQLLLQKKEFCSSQKSRPPGVTLGPALCSAEGRSCRPDKPMPALASLSLTPAIPRPRPPSPHRVTSALANSQP